MLLAGLSWADWTLMTPWQRADYVERMTKHYEAQKKEHEKRKAKMPKPRK